MTDRDDAQLESLLREHFASKLDGQLGRAAGRFMREVAGAQTTQAAQAAQPAQPTMRLVGASSAAYRAPDERRGWSVFAWSIGLAGGAVAAGMAVVMIVVPMMQRPTPLRQANVSPGI